MQCLYRFCGDIENDGDDDTDSDLENTGIFDVDGRATATDAAIKRETGNIITRIWRWILAKREDDATKKCDLSWI